MATNPIPMIAPDYSSTKLVPQEQAQDAQAQGWEQAAKMVGPSGQNKWVPVSQVPQARQAQFAITQDSPGAAKMVSPQGQVNYVLPAEIPQFQQSGNTWVKPDGSFNLQNIPGEDPLAEQQRYQRVFNALSQSEQSGANRASLKEFGKSGLEAGIDTASGAMGAGGAGGAIDALTAGRPIVQSVGTGIMDAGGKEIMRDATTMGPSLAAQGMKAAAPYVPSLLKGLAGGAGLTGGGTLLWKLLRGSLTK